MPACTPTLTVILEDDGVPLPRPQRHTVTVLDDVGESERREEVAEVIALGTPTGTCGRSRRPVARAG